MLDTGPFARLGAIIILAFAVSTAGAEPAVFQLGSGAALSLGGAGLEGIFSAEGSLSWVDARLFRPGEMAIFTLNGGAWIRTGDPAHPGVFLDAVWWRGICLGAGASWAPTAGSLAPYLLLGEFLPLFAVRGMEDCPLVPVFLLKASWPLDLGPRLDLLIRLKYAFRA